MQNKKIIFLLTAITLFSFKLIDKKVFEFQYPKLKESAINLSADHFKKFSKEWRGTDYYYFAEEDGFICSVLYYKLNEEEKVSLVDMPKAVLGAPESSPAYPLAYFENYSNLKSMERNDSSWGQPTDDFMFRQNDVVIGGTKFAQKHMYGYCMIGKDLFVNVHLSHVGCTPADSTEMVEMLRSLVKKK
jgi:hypothetical protein